MGKDEGPKTKERREEPNENYSMLLLVTTWCAATTWTHSFEEELTNLKFSVSWLVPVTI